MRYRKVAVVLLAAAMVCGFSVASPLVAAGKKRADLLSLVIENIDMDYAYQIVEDLSSMGTATTIDGEHFGFRAAGSTASHEASMYVKDKMENYTHLVSVEADRFAVDAWEFRGAYVDVPGLGRIQAASHGGSPGTDADGITAEIVNVGNGYASDYPEDVTGKIVLANWIGYDFWVDSIAKEAELRGAAAIIVTTYDSDYGNQPGAIENHDGLYREGWPPMVSISGDDGLRIIEKLETDGPFEVTVWSDITITTMEEGGFGWNIVGYLPGKNFNWEHPSETEELLIVGDHTDAWFFGGMDDDSGIAAVLSLADAFKKAYDAIPSDKIPERSIVFVTHDAEEYGILDTYYDWCYGAWNEITAIHPEWVGNAVACLIMELMGMAGLPLDVNMSPELYGFVRNVLGQNTAKLPYGFRVTPVPHSWADHWTYAAAGVPGVEFATSNAWWDATYYHNQFDTIDTIDFGYLGQLFEVYADLILRLVTLPVIPYNLATTATNLWETLAHDEDFNVGLLYPIYEKWGFDPEANMGPTVTEAERFLTNAETLRHELGSLGKHVDPEKAKEINRLLMAITAKIGQTLIGQGVWEQDWYPYQQSANDVVYMDRGIDILSDPFVTDDDVTDAIWELNWVGIIWYYDYMSMENYFDQYAKLCGVDVQSWGLQTHLNDVAEIWEEYDMLHQLAHNEDVTPSDIDPVIMSLEEKMISQAFPRLEEDFHTMWTGLAEINELTEMLIAYLQG